MPTTIFTRQPDRENYLIESGNSLYNEQNAQVAKFVEDYQDELGKAHLKTDSIIAQIAELQRSLRLAESERDALVGFLNTSWMDRCREKRKKPEPHPDVPILLSAARMMAAEETKQ